MSEDYFSLEPIVWSHNLSNKLIEIIKTGVILTDIKATIRFANDLALKLLNHSRQSLIGNPLEMIFMPDDREIFLRNIIQVTNHEGGFEGEALLLGRDDTRLFVHLSTAMYRGDLPHMDLMIFTIQDITMLKQMEKVYQRSEGFANLGMITDQISHHIRNPIVSIGGFALRLAQKQLSKEEYFKYTNIIHSEARRLEYIIDRLAEFTKIQSATYQPMTIYQIIEGVREEITNFLEKDQSKVKFPDKKALSQDTIYGDFALIVKALLLIIKNSLEALRDGGEVSLEAKIKNHHVVFKVKDNGEGIQPKDLPFIFDPFFTTKFNNLGLGLTLVKRIIEGHKGSIDVFSLPKEGTTVTIMFPKERRREIRTKRFANRLS